jgi:hypothetical protein
VYAGGIVGTAVDGGEVSYAYATGAVSATGTGTGAGEGSTTLGAGGIAGAASNAPVVYTVALNSSVSVTETGSNYNKCSFRITSTSSGTVTMNGAPNYGKADLSPTGGSYQVDKGADQQDGEDVTVTGGPLPTAYTAPDKDWWTNTWFNGVDWITPWQWDATTGLPKLQ